MLNPRKRQCESRKLSTEQKLKVLKLYDEYTADPFPFSKRVIASKIGGKLNRNLDPKSVRNILAERANIESGGAHRNFYQTQTPEWQQWETQLDEKLKAAFEWGNLTIGFICQIALSFVRLNPAPKCKNGKDTRRKFGKKWARLYMRRQNWTYARVQGSRGKTIVDEGTIERQSEQLTELLEPYSDDQIINFDESSVQAGIPSILKR